MKTYSRMEVKFHILTSPLHGHVVGFTLRKSPGSHYTEEWVGPRTVQDVVVKRKIPAPY
jgi:hypothetical protein